MCMLVSECVCAHVRVEDVCGRVSSRGNHFGGEAPGNGCGFIYFSIQLSQILGGGEASPPPLNETLCGVIHTKFIAKSSSFC